MVQRGRRASARIAGRPPRELHVDAGPSAHGILPGSPSSSREIPATAAADPAPETVAEAICPTWRWRVLHSLGRCAWRVRELRDGAEKVLAPLTSRTQLPYPLPHLAGWPLSLARHILPVEEIVRVREHDWLLRRYLPGASLEDALRGEEVLLDVAHALLCLRLLLRRSRIRPSDWRREALLLAPAEAGGFCCERWLWLADPGLAPDPGGDPDGWRPIPAAIPTDGRNSIAGWPRCCSSCPRWRRRRPVPARRTPCAMLPPR
jgi:hypothetical protein